MTTQPNTMIANLGADELSDLYVLGLDLGQARDFSALAALRRRLLWKDGRQVARYLLRGLKRWPLGTLYPNIVADVVDLVSKPPLSGGLLGVDRTGCGAPVVDLLRQARPQATIKPVLITAGFAVSSDGSGWHVPKRELVAALQLVLQTGRLEVPDTIAEAATLQKELLAFRAKITATGNEQFEADWRQRAHDDMVLAVAIAVWLGERMGGPRRAPVALYGGPDLQNPNAVNPRRWC